MAKYSIEDTTLTNIADAIREKGGTTESLTPTQMPDAISAIEAGGGAALPNRVLIQTNNVTNVTYPAASGYDTNGTLKYVGSTAVEAGRTASSLGGMITAYVWKQIERDTSPWDAWNCACFGNSSWTEGHRMRILFYVWSVGEEVEWKNHDVYINDKVSTTHNASKITNTPQLVDIQFTWTKGSAYASGKYSINFITIYPDHDGTTAQLYITPPVVIDLDNTLMATPFAY